MVQHADRGGEQGGVASSRLDQRSDRRFGLIERRATVAVESVAVVCFSVTVNANSDGHGMPSKCLEPGVIEYRAVSLDGEAHVRNARDSVPQKIAHLIEDARVEEHRFPPMERNLDLRNADFLAALQEPVGEPCGDTDRRAGRPLKRGVVSHVEVVTVATIDIAAFRNFKYYLNCV
jgi:hypothetical protein